MSTELRAALREAVANAPADESDLRSVVHAGSRRVRRRTAFKVATSAVSVAVVAVLTSVVVGSDRSDQEPRPADVVHLDLDQAETQDLEVLASARTTWREPMNELDHDQFEGLTTDGRVLRSRYTADGDIYELGLLDPGTGRTDWLPSPPVRPKTVVELTADRLVLSAWVGSRRSALLVFDRATRTWESGTLRLPAGLEVHIPFRVAMGHDDRLFLGSTFEGESGPLSWWSYTVPEGGVGRPEPALDGAAAAWGVEMMATAENDGRVVLSTSAGERVVADQRPAGCEPPTDPDLASMPILAGLAGNRPVVTYWCGDQAQATTIAYGAGSGDDIQVSGAALLAADDDHVLLAAAQGQPSGVYLIDLDRLTLARIGSGIHEAQVGLADGLVLWNQPGPIDDKDVYDVVWKVAGVPLGD
ncbi:MAG: hypothetical protein ACXWDI_16055 [Nocardioides sp.]